MNLIYKAVNILWLYLAVISASEAQLIRVKNIIKARDNRVIVSHYQDSSIVTGCPGEVVESLSLKVFRRHTTLKEKV